MSDLLPLLQDVHEKVTSIQVDIATLKANHSNLDKTFSDTKKQCDQHEKKINQAHGLALLVNLIGFGSIAAWAKSVWK